MEKQMTGGAKPQHSIEFLRKRKFLLVLPLLILPFTSMAFWALGGGKAGQKTLSATANKGIDMALPSAQFKDTREKDKMDLYQSANKDSARSANGVNKSFIHSMGFDARNGFHGDSIATNKINSGLQPNPEQQSAKIEARIAQINRQINQPQTSPRPVEYGNDDPETIQNVRKVKKMMRDMNSGNRPDPEIQQLSKMMEQLQALQNPSATHDDHSKLKADSIPFRAIPAIIDGRQKVATGAAVKLRLTDTATIKNQLLPKGQEIFGSCQVVNQRLLLTIQNIRLGKQIIPVNLIVFSLDGMAGIPAPEAELSGAATGGADDALQSMQFLSMDQSIGAQAAAGGVNAAKGLFSKKVKKVKVKLKDEYPVLLKISR